MDSVNVEDVEELIYESDEGEGSPARQVVDSGAEELLRMREELLGQISREELEMLEEQEDSEDEEEEIEDILFPNAFPEEEEEEEDHIEGDPDTELEARIGAMEEESDRENEGDDDWETGETDTDLVCPICSGTFLDLITLETHAEDCDGTQAPVQEDGAFMEDDPELEAEDDLELEAFIEKQRTRTRAMEERKRQLQKEAGDVRKEISAKEARLQELKNAAERTIGSKAPETIRLVKVVKESDQAVDRMLKKQTEIEKLDAMKAELDAKKVELVQEFDKEKAIVGKLTKEKRMVENVISVKTEEVRNDIEKLEEEIESLKAAESVQKKAVEDRAQASPLPDSWKFDYITKKIEAKEKDLECPVCFEVASTPIFKCLEDHLICSVCRPKVLECPECRVRYTGEPRRHRYAEKAAVELEGLWRERAEVLGD